MNIVPLSDICDLQNGFAFKSDDYVEHSTTLNCRMSNIRPDGNFDIEYNPKYLPDSYTQKYKDFLLKDGDIVIAMTDMANDPKILGVPTIVDTKGYDLLLNQRVGKLIFHKKDEVDVRFLQYSLNRKSVRKYYTQFAGGGLQLNVGKKEILSVKIPLPPLPQQHKIANILDAADAVRQNDKALIAKYDELTQALFLDMFGDPVSNPKGWKKVSLSEYGSFKNGLNFNNSESGVSLKYLGVGDFKSKSRIDDAESLSNIELNSLPNDGYLLNDGDLVFVRSNGNRALVGRCVEVYPKNNKLTFSGFCIRYRINSHLVKPTYLSQLFRNKSFKNLMLESGQGANIQNINQQILSSIDVPLPSLNLQEQFVKSIQAIEEQKAIAQKSLEKSESLFNSLLQKAFKGEL
jgi:type I restriction enzyme S subunit